MNDNCNMDSDRECLGINKAKSVASDVKALDNKLREFQQSVADTNSRFGARIGKLEAREEVRDEQYKNIREKLDDITKDVVEFQREQKGSISELRSEHKESMEELKKGNKDILEIVTPLKHKVDALDKLAEEVDELKEKPGKTWEEVKSKVLGWGIALILAIVAAALGLSQFT